MTAAAAKAGRLLRALDELAAEESIWLRAGLAGPALSAHQRAAPLLAEFCRLVSDPAVAGSVRPALAAWQDRRCQNLAEVNARRTQLLAEGERIAGARIRLSRIVSAYRRTRVTRRVRVAV